MILNVHKTELQLNPNILIEDIVRKAAYCTGVSESSIYRVIREYNKTTHILKSPQKVKLRKKISESVNEFERNAMRREVHDVFFFRYELPSSVILVYYSQAY
jgi:predicted DNA-binding transcriptional regulator AlpA